MKTPPTTADVRVGGYLWHFDSNRRCYHKTAGVNDGPIYREHWHLVEIKGETSRSWVTAYGKCPKKGGRGWALTDAEVDDDVYQDEHRHRIAARIGYGLHGPGRVTPAMLRKVAEIIGYDPKK